jgi:hypothetical protein
VKCGLIADIFCEELKGLRMPPSIGSIGRPGSIRIEIQGVCRSCIGRKKSVKLSKNKTAK